MSVPSPLERTHAHANAGGDGGSSQRLAADSVFAGRRSELERLCVAFDAARAGRPCVAVVQGPPGIGKTTLVARFLAEAGQARILSASGDESEQLVEYGLADQLLRRSGAQSVLGAVDHVGVGLTILSLVGGGDETPVVLVIDDAHWADVSSLRSLLFATRRLVDEPVLVILVTRSAQAAVLPEGLRRHADLTLSLRPLGPDELTSMAMALDVVLAPRAARRLAEHTGGNPLYARALLEELPAEVWNLPHRQLPVPDSYGEVIATRAASLSPAGRGLVDAASVLGLGAPLSWAAAVAEVERPLDALSEAVAAGLLAWDEHDPERRVHFAHPLARVAIYHELDPASRSNLHNAAAAVVADEGVALQHRIAAAPGADARLAAEAEAFARGEAARGAWRAAAPALRAASALSDTRTERERLLLDAIEATLFGGDGTAARELAVETARFASGPRVDSVLAYLALYHGDVEQAEERLERSWASLDQDADPYLAATVASVRGFLAINRLQGHDVIGWAQRSRELEANDSRRDALSSTLLASGLFLVGRRHEAHRILDAALSRADAQNGFPLRSLKGALLLGEDNFAAARPVLTAAIDEARRIGSLVIAAQSLALRAKLEFARGEWDSAAATAEQACALAVESEEPWVQAFTDWTRLHVPLARGEHVPAPCGSRSSSSARIGEVEALARAEVAAAQRIPQDVIAALEPLADGPGGYWCWRPLLAEAFVDSSRREEARALLDADAGEWGPSVSARLSRATGRLAAAEGRHREATTGFEAALALSEPLGTPYELALTQLEYGRYLRRERRRREATAHLLAARETFEALRAGPMLEPSERELAACGLTASARGDADTPRLTPQEHAVAELVASGLGNQRVATELLVSVRTVESHLTRIYRKLGVSSRAELAARFRTR